MDPVTLIVGILAILWLSSGGGGGTIPISGGGYGSGYPGSGGYSSYSGPRQGGGNVTSGDAFVLAQTVYGEARNQSATGRQGVCSVIMNRFHAGNYGSSVTAVCKAPNQFDCWNAGDPNLAVIQNVNEAQPLFAECLRMAQSAVSGNLADNTQGALRYYDTSISMPQSWINAGWRKTVQYGQLVFCRQGGVS